jgi:hypothetical protein
MQCVGLDTLPSDPILGSTYPLYPIHHNLGAPTVPKGETTLIHSVLLSR